MKKKSLFLVLTTLLLSVLAISPSQADGCTVEDPCETWAVLDSDNKVINIIICQLSFCGSGFLGENRVVRQVASNPVTNDTKNTGGYNSDANKTVTYNNENSTFTVSDTRPVESTVINVTENVNENVVTVISTTISKQPEVIFTYNDTKANPTQPIANKEYKNDTKATISISETKITDTESTSVGATVTLDNRVTEDDAVETVENHFNFDIYLNDLFSRWFPVWGSFLAPWFI